MKALILRTVRNDMISSYNFKWPESGHVEAPDWNKKPVCGNGLHGLLWGCGDGGYLNWDEQEFVGLVVEVEEGECVDLCGKVKFPKGNVVFCGNVHDAANYIYEKRPGPICGIRLVGGNEFKVMGGNGSTLTGGDYSTLTGGNEFKVMGGHCSTLTGGNGSILTGGWRSTLTGGNGSTLTGGDYSTLTGGNGSTLTGGEYSTLTGGINSILSIKYWDYKNSRFRIKTEYVGENGIEPNTPYKLNEDNEFEKVMIHEFGV